MCIQLFIYIYIYIDLALVWVRPVTNFYYTHLAGASVMDKDTKMAWHDIAGRLASNEEGARSKALHFWLPPKTFLFTHLVFDFSGLPPCSQSTLKRVWVKHGNKKPWHRRVTWTSPSCVFRRFCVRPIPVTAHGDMMSCGASKLCSGPTAEFHSPTLH